MRQIKSTKLFLQLRHGIKTNTGVWNKNRTYNGGLKAKFSTYGPDFVRAAEKICTIKNPDRNKPARHSSRRQTDIRTAFRLSYRTGRRHVNLRFDNVPHMTIHLEHGEYSRSSGWYSGYDTQVVTYPLMALKHIGVADDLIHEVLRTRNVGGVIIHYVNVLLCRKSTFCVEKKYIADNGSGVYCHAEKIKDALTGLRRKLEKKAAEKITLETSITKKIYHKITGACMTGIKSFCELHDIKNGIKAKELVSILQEFQPFGWDKFVTSIQG